jgi:plastocyanin
MRAWTAGVLVAFAVLAAPATAGAATKTVQAGPFGAAQEEFQEAFGDANAYFRRTITIRRGDRVRWRNNGFHTVTFVPDGADTPPLFIPDTSSPITGSNDAAGSPFWFNGQPSLRFNPTAALPQGGGRFDPTELRNSGLPLGPPEPYRLRFNRKGTFDYLCIVHPGMEGKVRVVGRNANVPSRRKDRRAARRQRNVALNRVQRLTTGLGTEDLQNTIQAGNDRRSGPTIFKFFPANSSYRVGDTVTLQMAPRSTDVHTLTFGPSNGRDAYNDVLAASFQTEQPDQRALYPSENPALGVPTITPTTHGNGFYNSGILDVDSASPLPSSTRVRFGAPGTYQLICLIHPFMTGTVTVNP